jgi:hypothetical protein
MLKDMYQGQDCWIEVQDPKGKTFIAKRLDESVLAPKRCKWARRAWS